MNRSLLLVVCDFLLLSILALARFDVPEGATIAQDDQKVVSKSAGEENLFVISILKFPSLKLNQFQFSGSILKFALCQK